MIADTQDTILQKLVNTDSLNSSEVQAELGLTNDAIYAELVSLVALKYINIENKKVTRIVLTAEGINYATQGTPEARIFGLASMEGTPK
jgi:predicted transcriptional regulator